jgi:hypothetical protein
MKSNEEIGAEAARLAHANILQEAKRAKLTTRKVLRRLVEGLDAKETKCKFDGGQFGTQEWVYSKKLVAHGTRLEAVKIAASILNLIPDKGQTQDGEGEEATPVTVTIQVIDASKGASEQTTGAVPCPAE